MIVVEVRARVQTPSGPGIVVHTYREKLHPLGLHPREVLYAIVQLDDGKRRTYSADQLRSPGGQSS